MNYPESFLNLKTELRNDIEYLNSSTNSIFHNSTLIESPEPGIGPVIDKISNISIVNNEIDLRRLNRNGEKCAEIYFNDGEIIYFCLLCPNKFQSAEFLEHHLFTFHYLHDKNWNKNLIKQFNTFDDSALLLLDQKNPLDGNCDLLEPLCKIEAESDNEINDNIENNEIDELLEQIETKKIKTSKKKESKNSHDIELDGETDITIKKPKPFKSIIINGTTRFQCHDCEKNFANKGSLRKHERIIHSGRIKFYVCEQCGKALTTSDAYKNHLRIHTGEKPYKCDVCGSAFRALPQLINHKITHSDKRNFKCDYCDARFHTRAHKRVHERTHTGEKPYQCDSCGMNFACTSSLKTHTKRHMNTRTHVCEICKNSFVLKQDLRRHMRVHSNEREFHCYVCNASYKGKRELLQHHKIHQNTREYRCKICGDEFVRYSKIYHHMKMQHCASGPVSANIIYTPVDGIGKKKGGRPPIKMFLHKSFDNDENNSAKHENNAKFNSNDK